MASIRERIYRPRKVKPAGELKQTQNMMRYGFACGKLSVRSTKALDDGLLNRLLDTESIQEQARILAETPYAKHLEQATSQQGLEKGLDDALEDAYSFLHEAEMPEAYERYFRMRVDFDNIKSIVKARHMRVSPHEYLSEGGYWSHHDLLNQTETLPESIRTIFETLTPDELQNNVYPTAEDIDDWVDNIYFAQRLECARATKSAYLVSLALLDIDIANAKVLMRAIRAQLMPDVLERKLIALGSLEIPKMISWYTTCELSYAQGQDACIEQLATKLKSYKPFSQLEVDQLIDTRAIDVALRALYDRALLKGLRMPPGPEPIVAYIGRIEAEISLLRIVLVGLANKVSRERLRQFVMIAKR